MKGKKPPRNRIQFVLGNYTNFFLQENEGCSLILMLQIQHFGLAFLGPDPKFSVTLKTVRNETNKVC